MAAPAGVNVEVRDETGRTVHSLGHFTVPGRQRLILSWDGSSLPPGTYFATVTVDGENGGNVVRAPLELRPLPGANDADRQPVREPRNA